MSVTVLMSVYKKEKPEYLELAFKSLWDDQTLKPDEVIVVEDGDLTDSLNEIIIKWQQKIGEAYIQIKNANNLGLTKSLNIGIQHITCKYIARMDSDDICLPDRFKKQKEHLDSHPDIAVVGSFVQEIDENNTHTVIRKYPVSPEEVSKYIMKATPLQHSDVMMRSEIFKQGISYNEKYRMTQDLALWFDILNNKMKIANIPEILFLFRITPETFSRRNKSKAFHEFKIYMNGIFRLRPVSLYYIYPVIRLILRLLPAKIIKLIYDSGLRKKALK